MNDIVIAVLSGGAVVAIVEGIKEAFAWRRNRKAQIEDREEAKSDKTKNLDTRITNLENDIADLKQMVEALVEGQKNVLFDRIQFLCRRYISEGEIEFDNLRGLNALHHSYHDGLGGNGDLDALMKSVHELPMKGK